jgi:hypothetical protein
LIGFTVLPAYSVSHFAASGQPDEEERRQDVQARLKTDAIPSINSFPIFLL